MLFFSAYLLMGLVLYATGICCAAVTDSEGNENGIASALMTSFAWLPCMILAVILGDE